MCTRKMEVWWYSRSVMLKVLVFDTGSGGEMFADYIEQELAVVEVLRELHYEMETDCSLKEMQLLTEAALLPHIGKVDVIVLASYEITLATLKFLQRKYPRQKFVGFWPRLCRRLERFPDGRRVMLLASKAVQQSAAYNRELEELNRFEIIESEHGEWAEVEAGMASAEDLRKERKKTGEIDAILVYCTDYHYMKRTFEKLYGWQVRVIDDYAGVFRDTCLALGLRGVDGGRSRF